MCALIKNWTDFRDFVTFGKQLSRLSCYHLVSLKNSLRITSEENVKEKKELLGQKFLPNNTHLFVGYQ